MKFLKTTLIAAILPSFLMAQTRVNSPQIQIGEEPIGVLDENFKGWSYSLDGKWISGEQCVYHRILSVQEDLLNSDEQKLGIDNFNEIRVHELYYGKDTLLLLLKPFEAGYYKYPRSKTGWKTELRIHYFVIEKPKEALAEINDTVFHSMEYKLYDSGTLNNTSVRRSIDEISQRLNLTKTSNRYLYLDFEVYKSTSVIRFMLYANHEIFHDLQGTVDDLTIRGKSLFGTPQLLNYIYFEADLKAFSQLHLL